MKSFPCRMLLTPGILALVFTLGFSALGQDGGWRQVSPEDVAAARSTVAPGAGAEALIWEMRVDLDSNAELEMSHYVRVKIFSEGGREEFAKFDIRYDKSIKIKDLAARAIAPDGTITEIKKEDIFDREIVKVRGSSVRALSFAVPKLEVGSIVEYRYKEVDLAHFSPVVELPLQREVPVRKLVYYIKPRGKVFSHGTVNGETLKFRELGNGFHIAERFNVPAFREEPMMPPDNAVRPLLRVFSEKFSIPSAFFGGTFTIKYGLTKEPTEYWSEFGRFRTMPLLFMLRNSKKLKGEAEKITAGATTDREKLSRLYAFCQSEIELKTLSSSMPRREAMKLVSLKSLPELLERKVTWSPDHIDLLFGALAASLGMDVRLVLAPDRSKDLFDPTSKDSGQLTSSLIAIKDDEGYTYYKPGNKVAPFGVLSWKQQGSTAMELTETSYNWVRIPMASSEANQYRRSGSFVVGEDGTLEGDAKIELVGQPAMEYRSLYRDETDAKRGQDLRTELMARFPGSEISEVKIENFTEIDLPLVQRFRMKISGFALKTGKRLIVTPSVFEYKADPLFSASERTHEIFFRYPWSERDEVKITLPDGYSLELPTVPAPFEDPAKISSIGMALKYHAANRTLEMKRNFGFGFGNNIRFPASVYPQLKNIFDIFHKTDGHTISLIRD